MWTHRMLKTPLVLCQRVLPRQSSHVESYFVEYGLVESSVVASSVDEFWFRRVLTVDCWFHRIVTRQFFFTRQAYSSN